MSEQERAESSLRQAERRWRAMFDCVDDGFCVIQKVAGAPGSPIDFRYLEANPAFVREAGVTDVVGRTIREKFPGESEEWFRTYDEILTTGVPRRFVRDLPTQGRVLELYAFRLGEAEERCVGVRFKDVTDRIRSQQKTHRDVIEAAAAAEANAKFRAFFDQGAYFAGVLALDGTMIEANRLAAEGTGFGRAQLIGRKFWDCPMWTASKELSLRMKEAVLQAAQGRPFREEMPYFTADGSERVVDANLSPISDEGGRVLFVAAFGIDVTAHKQAENDLRGLAAKLAEIDRRKNEFLATLAHELRNPLAPLRNGLQLMKLAKGSLEVIEDSRSLMERQVSHLVRLVDDLLDVNRISLGKIELRKEIFPLVKAVQQAVETSRPLIEEHGHHLTIMTSPAPVDVEGDVTRLAQVVSNLLNNAAKYTPRGGHITVSVQPEGAEAVVSVRDDGAGIPAHMLTSVFELFMQADRRLEKMHGGLGIGLSLVKGLVELHNGTVEARSEGAQKGSEFVVRLPLATARERYPPQTGPVAAARTRSRRVLVVDDNGDAAASLAMMIKVMGHESEVAHDGAEALEIGARFRPDVILLDIGMPKLNGYEAARCIRQEGWGSGVTLVALTGWGQEEDRRKSREAGFDHHIVKPVSYETIVELLGGQQPADPLVNRA